MKDRNLTVTLLMRLFLGGTALLLSAFLLSITIVRAGAQTQATPPANAQPVAIYFFWGDGCPHCAKAKPFLATLAQQYPTVEVRAYEVWYSVENQQLFAQMAAAYGFEPSGVPTIFIGERYWAGYAEPLAAEIEAAVATCVEQRCRDAGVGIIPGITPLVVTPLPTAVVATAITEPVPQTKSDLLTIPWIGPVDLAAQSLVVSTALIALVDGFNPCSLWVLSVLLALTLNTGSRRKLFWVGLTFVTVTALIYMAFITGLFTMFRVLPFVGWVRGIVALAALAFAVVNIKDYFWYKSGISFTIAEEQKPGIYRGIRGVLTAGESTWRIMAATVVLAAGVSLVEFSCTAGFPVLWTNLLVAQQATALSFGLLLLLYMLIYQIDELGLFLVAVFTLKASRLGESEGRILKLIGGLLMLTLALVMLVNPAWMNGISSSLIVFAVAFGAAAIVLLLHRKVLPRFGIRIGSELAPTVATPRHHHKRQHR